MLVVIKNFCGEKILFLILNFINWQGIGRTVGFWSGVSIFEIKPMKLIQNEKKFLKCIIENARFTDTAGSEKLKISMQAVGKMRRKLESAGFIKRYCVQLDYESLGIRVFSVALFRLSPAGWQYYRDPARLLKDMSHNLIMLVQPQQGAVSHIAVHGFRNLAELDNYFRILNSYFSKLIEIRDIWSIPSSSALKGSFNQVLSKAVDEYDSAQAVPSFSLVEKCSDFGPRGMKEDVKLTANDKLVLQGLLKDGRMSDAAISRRNSLSTRAVGKIRMKLENKGVIRGYTAELGFDRLGLDVFAVFMLKEKDMAWEKFGCFGIASSIVSCDNVTHCFQTPDGTVTKILFCMFRDLRECDLFLKSMQANFNNLFDLTATYVAPGTSLVKNDFCGLLSKVVDEIGVPEVHLPSPDISRFVNGRD